MKQIDKKLSAALQDASVANPNGSVWPNPFSYLVSHIGLVSRHVNPSVTVTSFILSHMPEFMSMIRSGNVNKPGSPENNDETETETEKENNRQSFTIWHQSIVLEWMRFALESWTMFDLSPFIENRHDLLSCQNFCDSPIEELIKPFLPASTHHRLNSLPVSATIPATIAPAELTASMLQDWKGIRFIWTDDIAEHLLLDTQTKVVKLYSQIAFCHLHALANESSSLRSAPPPEKPSHTNNQQKIRIPKLPQPPNRDLGFLQAPLRFRPPLASLLRRSERAEPLPGVL
jgi:hypothetical protein